MRVRSIFLLALLVLPASEAKADKRIALVVGNATYQSVAPLANAQNDATLIAETLRDVGFTLIGDRAQLNLDKAAFDKAVQTFGNQLVGADVALFYYAGHGVQIRGSNYLVPVSANPVREADVDFQMVDVSLILRQMEGSGTRLNLVILDACRNNPFGGRNLRSTESGLAQIRAPEGTLLSYATQPGNVALDGANGHSPYTQALAETIRKPGLDIFQTFNQVGLIVKRATGGSQQPWVSSSPIDGAFYFSGQAKPELAAGPPQTSVVQPTPQPSRLMISRAALEQRSMAFLTEDMMRSQGSAAELVAYARKTLDDRVDYYGKITPRDEVLKDKERYAAHWPARSYRVRMATVRIPCDEGDATCQISGQVDFDLANSATSRRTSGTASFEYRVRFDPGGGRTFYEAGKILSTKR